MEKEDGTKIEVKIPSFDLNSLEDETEPPFKL